MPPRILILSASVGAGHLRAAEAVELALRQVAPEATVRNLDVLTLTNAAFRRLYGKAYFDLIRRAPHLVGFLYDVMDRRPSRLAVRDRTRRLVQRMNLTRLKRLLTDDGWDAIVNTHFLPAEIIARLRRHGRLDTPHATVTTDFQTHRLWVHTPCERYFTATPEGAINLASWGIDAATIRVTGVPIHPAFARVKTRAACAARQGLASDRPIVLQLGGGLGLGPVAQIHASLLAIEQPIQLVAVAGRNEKAKRELEAVACPPRHRRAVLGFTDQMDELMAAADLVVTKPGGLTVSECLARGCAMVVIDPIPGQETRNCDYLLENGCATKAASLATLRYKVEGLLAEPRRLARMKRSARRIARPGAAFDIAREVLTLIR